MTTISNFMSNVAALALLAASLETTAVLLIAPSWLARGRTLARPNPTPQQLAGQGTIGTRNEKLETRNCLYCHPERSARERCEQDRHATGLNKFLVLTCVMG